jgi:hypothetical protein
MEIVQMPEGLVVSRTKEEATEEGEGHPMESGIGAIVADLRKGFDRHSMDLNTRTVARSLSLGAPHGYRVMKDAMPNSTPIQHNISRLKALVANEVGLSTGEGELSAKASIQLA